MKHRKATSETHGPLFMRDGTVAVDAAKCPALHRSLEAGAARLREARSKWARVMELRAAGCEAEAAGLVKRLLGVQAKKAPMTPEKLEYLERYKREHKDEILQKLRRKRALRRGLAAARARR